MRGKSGHAQQFPSPHPSPSRGEGEEYSTPHLTSPSERNEVQYYLKSRHTELSEVFKAVLVKVNPSPQFLVIRHAVSDNGLGRKIFNPSPNLSLTARSFTKLNFAFSSPPHPSPLLKERENAVGLASDSKERK